MLYTNKVTGKDFYYCDNCKGYQFGTVLTGGFYCDYCGTNTIYYDRMQPTKTG